MNDFIFVLKIENNVLHCVMFYSFIDFVFEDKIKSLLLL
jgi:hypothetical protein